MWSTGFNTFVRATSVAIVTLLAGACSTLPNLADLAAQTAGLGSSERVPTVEAPVANLSSPPTSVPGPAAPQVAIATPREPRNPPGTPDEITILEFRAPTIVLYVNDVGNEGERVPTSQFQLPIKVRSAGAGVGRVQVLTVGGPRWIARDDIKTSAPL